MNDSRWLIRNAFAADSAEKAAKSLRGHIGKLKGQPSSAGTRYAGVFDIGVRAGGQGRGFEEVRLSAETLRQIAAVGGEIQVTIIPPNPWR